jgi:hypothetical protein
MLLGRNNYPVRFPEVAEAMAVAVRDRDTLPESLATGRTSVTDEVRDDLTSVATKSNPNPTLARSFQHE